MITSIVGRLIKKPEVAERIQIPGKHVVNFTVVDHRTRGQKRISIFFNLSVIVGTDAQFDLAMRLEKNAVLLFHSPHITFTRQTDKSETEQTINLYADADGFRVVSGLDVAYGASDPQERQETDSAPRRVAEAGDQSDPFTDSEY